jgi:hypothetical protein
MLSIASLPFLVYWGFGISTMSLVGNLLFTPVLALFLFFCTLLFFANLCGLPHGSITAALNFLTNAWHQTLGYGSKSWIVHCMQPSIFVLLLPIIALVAGLMHPFFATPTRRISLMVGILIFFFAYCNFLQKEILSQTTTIFFDKKLYGIFRTDNKLILIDDGYAAQKKSPEKVLEYQILPKLFKEYGSLHVADYVIKKPMCSSMKIAATLCKYVAVDNVSLPYFDAPEQKRVWWAYFDLKRTLAAHNVSLRRYSTRAAHWWRYRLRTRLLNDAPVKRQSYTKRHKGK